MKKDCYLRKAAFGIGFVLFMVSALILQIPGTVGAQQEDEYVLEDTVVTATKTGETLLQETAIAITVFDDEALDSTNMFRLTELDDFVPNTIVAQQGSISHLYMRGMGTPMMPATGSEMTVGFYIDGIYIEKALGAKSAFFDVERIEIQRGPQGVLFGRNATGGTINIITKAPTDELTMKAQYEMGSYSKRRVDFSISGPILRDKINGRFSLFDSQHDGYTINMLQDPDGSNENTQGFRARLDFFPSDQVEIQLSGDWVSRKEVGVATKLVDRGGLYSNVYPVYGLTYDEVFYEDFWTYSTSDPCYMNNEAWGISLTAIIALPHEMTFRSITAYREHNIMQQMDLSRSSIPDFLFHSEPTNKFWSQELQLDGQTDRWSWVAGFYFFNNVENWNNGFAILGFTPFIFGTPGPVIDYMTNDLDTSAYAFFGQATYALTDKLSATLGVRYSHDSKTGWQHQYYNFDVPPVFVSEPILYIMDGTWTGYTPKIGLDYKMTDDALLYVSAAKGWKSGMFYPGNYFPRSDEIAPETVWTYSIGAKTDWFAQRLRLNLEAFITELEDQQIVVNVLGRNQMIRGSADSQGFELEMTARPFQGLTLMGSFAYLDSEYTDLEGAETGGPLMHAPEFSASFNATYTVPVAQYGYLSFRGAVSWSDDHFFRPDTPQLFQHAYTLVSGFIRYETADGRWSIEAYGTNLTEEEYAEDRFSVLGDEGVSPGMPRFFGIQVGFKY